MSYDGAITALESHIQAVADTYKYNTQAGEPGTPPRKLITWWYDGDGANDLIEETLTDHPFDERLRVRIYAPVSTRAVNPSRALEVELRTVVRTLKARLWADRDLAGNVESLTIEDSDTGWLSLDNGWFRVASFGLGLGFTDTEPNSR